MTKKLKKPVSILLSLIMVFSMFAIVPLSASAATASYVKVTTAPNDWSGDYLIVYEDGSTAFNGSSNALNSKGNYIDVTISDGAIASDSATNAAKFTIAQIDGGYSIKSAGGEYIGGTSGSNITNTSSGNAYVNSISLDGGNAHIVSNTSVLRFNTSSTWTGFRYYKSTSYTNQQPIQLYKLTAAEPAQTAVPYMAWDSTAKQLVEKTGDDACADYTVVANDTTAFEDGKWYVVSEDVTVADRITVSGTANLILCDGKTLTASNGITVETDNTLNIFAQSTGESMGKLTAATTDGTVRNAVIGGVGSNDSNVPATACGTVNIHCGDISTSGYRTYSTTPGAGIGGGGGYNAGDGGTVTIYGGKVTARGGHSYSGNVPAPGIGGGVGGYNAGDGGTVTIYGGTVTATGGIGGGYAAGNGGDGGTVIIYDGTVEAYGDTGIGGGVGGANGGNGGNVEIYGGKVTTGGTRVVGIGGGSQSADHGTLTVGRAQLVFGGNSENPTTVIKKVNNDYARYRYMTVDTRELADDHEHTFVYTASGNTITAACSVENCEFSGLTPITLTLEAPSPVYDGNPKEAVLSGYPDDAPQGLAAAPTGIVYYTATAPGSTETTGSALSGAPTDAGNYVAQVTWGGETISVPFSIEYSLTINDGTNSNSNLPVYGAYADYYQKSQFVIPASDLTNLQGMTLTEMQFYLSYKASEVWDGTFEVYLGPCDFDLFSSSTFADISEHTKVYTGTLDGTGDTMNVVFDTGYTYTGGNLLVTFFEVETGAYSDASFYGVNDYNLPNYTGIYAYNSSEPTFNSPSGTKFVPKVTIKYSAPEPTTYTITWKNYDDTEIGTSTVNAGETPAFSDEIGEIKAKPENDDYTYTFSGWTPELTAATGDAEYKATFEATPKAVPAKLTINVGENGKVVMDNGTFGNATDASNINDIAAPFNVNNGSKIIIVDGRSANLVEGGSINIATGGEVSFYPSADNTGVITAIPDEDYAFIGWYNGDTLYSSDAALSYQSISEDITLTAKFERELFWKHSVTLGGDIGVNFYLNPAVLDTYTGAKTVTFSWDGNETTVDVPATATADGYKVTCNVVAAQMAHKIHAVVKADGTALAQTDDYSVQDYAETVYANPAAYDDKGKPDELKALAKALLNYGAMAQTVFYNSLKEHPALANTVVGNNGYEGVTADQIEGAIKGSAFTVSDVETALGAKFYTSSLIYLSRNTLRLYFTPTTYPGEIPNAGAYNGNLSGYYYYVDHANIPAAELDNQQTFSVNGTEFTFSALDYAKAVVESTKMEPEQQNLAKSLYLYNQAANAYFDDEEPAPHTHDFTYAADGATITATCNGAGTCDIDEGLSLTISAPTGELTANGTTTFPATLSTGYNTTAFPDTYTISYTKDGQPFDGTPTEAGAYTASVTVGTATASVSYTVAAPVVNYTYWVGPYAQYEHSLLLSVGTELHTGDLIAWEGSGWNQYQVLDSSNNNNQIACFEDCDGWSVTGNYRVTGLTRCFDTDCDCLIYLEPIANN